MAVNDLTDIQTITHLLKYDSIHGRRMQVDCQNNVIQFENMAIQYFQEKDPSKLPWKTLGVDIVIDATGIFKTYEQDKNLLLRIE